MVEEVAAYFHLGLSHQQEAQRFQLPQLQKQQERRQEQHSPLLQPLLLLGQGLVRLLELVQQLAVV